MLRLVRGELERERMERLLDSGLKSFEAQNSSAQADLAK